MLKKFSSLNKKSQRRSAILVVLIVAAIGTYLLVGSHAAAPYASITADKDTLANGATKQTCAGASDGNCVVFGGTSSGGGSVVNSSPTGPAAPSGGWHVAFADGFGAPIGAGPGQDNFWFPNASPNQPACSDQPGYNANELEVFNCSQVKVGPEGLDLVAAWRGGTGAQYVSGAVNTYSNSPHPTSWKIAPDNITWAFEAVARWPVNTGEMDPGWWSYGSQHVAEEVDFFEGWGWNGVNSTYNSGMPVWVGQSEHDVYNVQTSLFDPTSAFHRYTTVIASNGSNYTVSEYIDGQFKWNFNVSSPPQTFMALIISNALRVHNTHFQSGTRTFTIRSIGVYQDANHAGQDLIGGGVAPGTTVK